MRHGICERGIRRTFSEHGLLSFSLKRVQVIEKREHVLGWFLDSEQGFEAGQHQGGKLLRCDDCRDGEYVR
jgi:hypothetical protein